MEPDEKPQLRKFKASIERLRYLFEYNPITGSLCRLVTEGKAKAGRVFFGPGSILVDGDYIGHSVICFVIYHGRIPSGDVDHKDHDTYNNKIGNLREATEAQNQWNKVITNPHGFKGVTWRNRKAKPWLSKIRVNGKRINLGSFATKEEAAEAYRQACLKYHGEFACLEIY